jgi:L-seryl-tRNA(Ser) seleniumtransferase
MAAIAARLREPLAAAIGDAYGVEVIGCMSQIGSGSLPLETLPSMGIAITPAQRKGAGRKLDQLASAFRALPIPVIGRIKDGAFILDLRCLDDEAAFLKQITSLHLNAAPGAADAEA